MPDQFEQYYKYLKSNGADVAPDFNSFKNTLSNYDNASKYYTYLKDNKFDVPETYDSFADTFGLKKKVGGEISSLTELPSEFIEPLKKGVSPDKTTEEVRAARALGVKPTKGEVIIPTNLPKQDQMRYERELKTQDAAINTLTDIYKQKGLRFDPNKPAAQKQIQDYIDQERSNDLVRVTGKDGKQYLTRGQGFIETGAKALVNSVAEPFESAEINFTNNPSDLANLLDRKIAEEPNVPEGAPTKVGGYLGGLVGGLPKMMGLLAIPYFGEAAMVSEMYHNAVAGERRALYERGLAEGLDRETAAKKAMETAPVAAVPDAAMGLVLARGVGGKNILPEAEKRAFTDALAPFKDVAKVAGLGGVAESSKALAELGAGYKVTGTEVLERGGKGLGEYALMDGAFKIMHKAGTIAGAGLRASKAVVSAAKNLLSTVPKEILEVQAQKYPDGNEIIQKVDEFAKVKDEVKDLVPPEKVGSVAGLTEKIKTIQSDIDELKARREKTTDALKPQIDEWLKEYQNEIDFYNNQINKVVKSKDPSGISEEVDDVTGEKIGAKKYIVDGKEVSQQEFEAMQEKPTGTKEIITTEVKPEEVKVTEEVKPTEVKKEPLEEFNTSKNKEELTKAVKDLINIDPYSPEYVDTQVRSALMTPGEFERGKQMLYDKYINPLLKIKTEVKPTEVSGIVATENAFPVSELNKIPKGELNRTEESQNKLKEDISENGIKEPLTLVYYVKDNALRLKEGHHRLDAANKLGLQDVPIKVQVEWDNSIKEDRDIQGQELYQPPVPLDIESYKKRNYQPTNIKLSELGFKEKSVQEEVKPSINKTESFFNDADILFPNDDIRGGYAVTNESGKQIGRVKMSEVNENTVKIDEVVSEKKGERTGNGSAIMKMVVDNADKNNVKLVLTPNLIGEMKAKGFETADKLRSFYEKFGFVKDKGKATMTRESKIVEIKEAVKPTEVKVEPIDIRKELRSQIDKKEIELIEKQQFDIDKAKKDLKEIENDNQEVISEYVKKSGYKLITKDTINPASKKGEKFPESDIGKYYKFTGSSLIRNSAKNLALKGAEAKAKSTPQGSKAGMNKYSNALNSIKNYENGDITKNQLLKIIKDSGLDIEKFEIKKQEIPTEVKEEITIEEEPTQSDIAKQQTIETDLLIGGQAAQRRKDNKYTKDGVEYIRNSKGNGVPSSVTGDVRFTNEVSLPFKYKLIEAKDLQPSHQDGIRNPNHFIPEAQPKNRNDAGSLMAENSFSSKPRFEELGENTNAYSGAPIVNERGEVVQGNNRAAGLRKGYDAKNQQYKNDLANNSSQFGFTKEQVEKMNEPILVREVAVSDEGAIEVGNYDVKDLETGGKRRLDPIAITRRMPFDIKGRIAEMLFTGEETLNQAIRANQKRVLELLNPYLNQAQRNTITKEGVLTDAGIKDLEDVVKQFLFDNGDTALPDLFENLSANQKEGLKKSLPYIFSTSPDKSIVPDIQEAILAVADFRDSGAGDFNAWLAQGDMFADGKTPRDKYTPLEIEIAKTLIEAKTQKEIVKKFGDYSDIVKDKEANMFDPAIAGKTRAEGIKEIFKTEDYAKPISERGGKTPVRKEELAAEPSPKPRNAKKEKIAREEAPEKGVEEAYKDLTINQKRQIINSKFDELLKELKIEKICPT